MWSIGFILEYEDIDILRLLGLDQAYTEIGTNLTKLKSNVQNYRRQKLLWSDTTHDKSPSSRAEERR